MRLLRIDCKDVVANHTFYDYKLGIGIAQNIPAHENAVSLIS